MNKFVTLRNDCPETCPHDNILVMDAETAARTAFSSGELNMKRLYTWKSNIRFGLGEELTKEFYGTYLATNSDGKFVMEEKGTGEVHVVDKDDVEEVIPYTVDVKFVGGNKIHYSYFSEKGKWNKGDLLVINTINGIDLVTVQSVDTKNPGATKDIDVVGRVVVDTV